jgi:hypothetical protein
LGECFHGADPHHENRTAKHNYRVCGAGGYSCNPIIPVWTTKTIRKKYISRHGLKQPRRAPRAVARQSEVNVSKGANSSGNFLPSQPNTHCQSATVYSRQCAIIQCAQSARFRIPLTLEKMRHGPTDDARPAVDSGGLWWGSRWYHVQQRAWSLVPPYDTLRLS